MEAIGVGSAGVIDTETGRVISATDAIQDWVGTGTGTGIRTGLEQRNGLRTAVVNDVHAHALGETWLGADAGSRTSLMVAFGTGVGGSLVINGKPCWASILWAATLAISLPPTTITKAAPSSARAANPVT